MQSAYGKYHSTETALIRVVNDIHRAIDDQCESILVLLDLSAAFDTIDHAILLERLRFLYGFFNLVLQWFTSYLVDRRKRIVFHKFSFPASSFILWSPSRLHFRTGVIFSLYFSIGGCSYSSRLKSNDIRRRFSALHYYETKRSFYSIKKILHFVSQILCPGMFLT